MREAFTLRNSQLEEGEGGGEAGLRFPGRAACKINKNKKLQLLGKYILFCLLDCCCCQKYMSTKVVPNVGLVGFWLLIKCGRCIQISPLSSN